MSECIFPPAPSNDNAVDALYPSQHVTVPVDRDMPGLSEADALLSDVGSWDGWVALAHRLKKSERSGRTGASRRKRRVTR